MIRTVMATFVTVGLFIHGWAGVIVQVESKDLRTNRTTSSEFYAQGEMLRMNPESEREQMTVIFRDNQMLVLNHKEKTYHRIDEEMMQQMSAQMSSVMQQMEAQLAQMPPEQRAMVERMMKEQMKGAPQMGGGSQRPPYRVESEGSEQVKGYDCRKYGIYRGREKTQEMCVVSPGDLEGGEEAMEAFRAMARFSEALLESFQEGPFADVVDNPFQFLHQIDGFPILTRDFDDGQAVEEVTFSSIKSEDLDSDYFSPPSDYRLVDPFKQGR